MSSTVKNSDTTFVCVGVSHWKTPVEIRELFSLDVVKQAAILEKLCDVKTQSSFVISTCNRTELYAITSNPQDVYDVFRMYSNASYRDFSEQVFIKKGMEAMEHLYEMTIGIDSQILGDLQIVNQVREAFQMSQKLGFIDSNFHRLMQNVLQACKQVRTETDLCSGAASVPHAVIVKLKEVFSDLSDKKILLYGVGKMGTLTVKNLVDANIKDITVINRSIEKAEILAKELHVTLQPISNLNECIAESDIIIVATGATFHTITNENVQLSKKGTSQAKCFVDLSVPRNIDNSIQSIIQCQIIDMDDLHSLNNEVLNKRKIAIPYAQKIIRKSIYEYLDWVHSRAISPVIQAYKQRLHEIKESEIEQYKSKYTEEELERITRLTNAVVNRIANQTIENLKQNFKKNPNLSDSLAVLFNLENTTHEVVENRHS